MRFGTSLTVRCRESPLTYLRAAVVTGRSAGRSGDGAGSALAAACASSPIAADTAVIGLRCECIGSICISTPSPASACHMDSVWLWPSSGRGAPLSDSPAPPADGGAAGRPWPDRLPSDVFRRRMLERCICSGGRRSGDGGPDEPPIKLPASESEPCTGRAPH